MDKLMNVLQVILIIATILLFLAMGALITLEIMMLF